MDQVDLRQRREDHARRRPSTPSRSVVRDPLFLLMAGFASGSLASFFLCAFIGYHVPFASLLLNALSLLALLLYAVWRPSGPDAEGAPSGSGSPRSSS